MQRDTLQASASSVINVVILTNHETVWPVTNLPNTPHQSETNEPDKLGISVAANIWIIRIFKYLSPKNSIRITEILNSEYYWHI